MPDFNYRTKLLLLDSLLQERGPSMSAAVRKLFSEMMAEAARMPDFNYRSYFLRRITHSFKEGEEFRKDEDIHKSLASAQISLDMLKRQASIGELYNPRVMLSHEKEKPST